jgi:hypothetical protein
VPALKYALKRLGPGDAIPYTPDHFDTRPIATDKVRQNAKEYKALLSRYIFLSAFSFFEAYFHDVLEEVINFHGGDKILERVSITHNQSVVDGETETETRKLQEYPHTKNRDRYLSYGKRLAQKGYRFPSTLLSCYGLRALINRIESDTLRAADIPDLARDVLQINFDQTTEIAVFHRYREIRNRIAHGRARGSSLHLKQAVEANNFLRNLALKIDRHVVENFFIVEGF